ncbi:hypothetical protein [Sphaerotilus mobilis]|uniref:Secreted protein n=1 Tax=Sphaerotilus mobilis TaxID=47994 RepID=A0A4V2EVR2_9BURK|nr:hypothetical protein [Sphaerotilus mobilis]RZS53380.1 hypothetical protein EV685_3008 [Sphaerotilus mobilis]
MNTIFPSIQRLAGACTLGLALSLWTTAPAAAAPFVPASDDVVVETLRGGLAGAARQAERARRAQLMREPRNLLLALATARAAIEGFRRSGDPRELGQAQAALSAWWTEPTPPAVVRLLRGTVRQSLHDFSGALADLDGVLADPAATPALQAQAELTRASVLQVQGRIAEADAGCARLQASNVARRGAAADGAGLAAQVCRAELASLSGRAAEGEATLARLATQAPPALAGWLALVRAEGAERRGRTQAGAFYRQALSAQQADGGEADVYTLAALADWLLDHGQPREVLSLLAGREEADALLLRLALAQQAVADPRTAGSIATLQARFEAAAARGDLTHRREQARFELHLKDRAAEALRLAQQNWSIQKEPADARLLVDAARAAGRPEAARPVLEHVRATGLVDVRLRLSADRTADRPADRSSLRLSDPRAARPLAQDPR